MAIALDAITNGANNNNALSVTVTGANPVLIAFIEGDQTDTQTGATYNSVAMTLVDKVKTPSDRWQYCWVLFNPATGAHTLATSGSTFMQINSISYTGVTSKVVDNFIHATAVSATTDSAVLNVHAPNCWIAMGTYGGLGGNTPGSGFINRGALTDGLQQMDTNGIVTSGNQTCAFSAISSNLSLIAVSFSPLPFAGTGMIGKMY